MSAFAAYFVHDLVIIAYSVAVDLFFWREKEHLTREQSYSNNFQCFFLEAFCGPSITHHSGCSAGISIGGLTIMRCTKSLFTSVLSTPP